jgi:polyphosphate kinase
MNEAYTYFKRDLSWLSFNYRVLLEAADESLPLYERINFISIFTSNLEEFYRVRVAEYRAIAFDDKKGDYSKEVALETLQEITREVDRQFQERTRIYESIIPALRAHGVYFYQGKMEVNPMHFPFIHQYFDEEIFPYLQPVPVRKGFLHTFLRDNRLYMAVRARLLHQPEAPFEYFIFKLPYSKVPRFVELPSQQGNYYLMYMEDIIKMNIHKMFPGYEVDSRYCFKISRDADIFIDDIISSRINLETEVKKKVKKRKTGSICRFVYDRFMPADFLAFLCDAFSIERNELSPSDKHLNLEDLSHLPNPCKELQVNEKPTPMTLNCLNKHDSILHYVRKKDLLLHYPYHSFSHFIHLLYEAANDPRCTEIMITQYRVAEDSAVINSLISAAQNGKKVTVFVELKARFDEEHNLATSELMKRAGIHIIYSIPGLKVHAKVVLILRANAMGKVTSGYGCISTGNFNEKTANIYADSCLITSKQPIIHELQLLFAKLKGECEAPVFKHLLVAQYNLVPELQQLIAQEIALAKEGKGGRIILKMNALQDTSMIDELYRASEAGVEIDLIVRGICCLKPNQPYSKHIRITRIVDSFLEHARIWYFGNNGNPKIFLGSPDWMKRNLYRRIEAVAPITDKELQQEISDFLQIQLTNPSKACWVDEHQQNVFKYAPGSRPPRPQYLFYDYLKRKNK